MLDLTENCMFKYFASWVGSVQFFTVCANTCTDDGYWWPGELHRRDPLLPDPDKIKHLVLGGRGWEGGYLACFSSLQYTHV